MVKNNGLKRTLAAILSLVIVGGALPGVAGSGISPVKTLTASAETTTQEAIINFDSATSTLTLDGCITYRDLEDYRSNKNVKHITCEYGTVFKGCERMFIGAFASDSNKWDWENVETIDLSYASFPEETSMYCMFSNLPKLTTVDFSRCSMPQVTNMRSMFKGCPMLTSVDLSDCSMPNVTDISHMFGNCQSLTSVDFSKTDTSSITIADFAFYKCKSLTSLDNVKFNTSNLTQAEEMFSNSGLTIADLSDWNTKKLRNAESFFEHCNSLGFVYLGDFGSDNVHINNMFVECSSLCLITTKRTDSFIDFAMSRRKVFYKCTSLVGGNGTSCDGENNIGVEYACIDTPETPGYFTYECCDLDSEGTLTLSGLVSWRRLLYYKNSYYNSKIKKIVADETAILPDDCSDLFSGFEYVKEIDLSAVNCDTITDVSGMFYGCSSLKTIDISGIDLSAVDTSDSAFAYCPALETIYVSSDSNRSDMSHSSGSCVFDNCTSLVGGSGTAFVNVTSVRYAHIDGGTSNPGYFSVYVDGVKYQDGVLTISKPFDRSTFSNTEYVDATKIIVTADAVLPAECRRLFSDFKNVTEIDLTNADLSVVTSMNSMFSGCSALESVKWCSGYKTSNVTDMASMFFNCRALKSPGIKGLNTSRVTDMSNLFNGCTSLKNLDIGDSFDTSSVTNMASMFKGCTSLIRLNLGSFDTSNVTSMTTMFQNCSALTMFDLSNFSTGNVTSMFGMFSGCSSAKRIYVDDGWDTSSVTSDSNMFFNCSALEGGNGTVFDSDYIDRTYACIDSEDQPGYFSWKTCAYDAKTQTLHLRGAVNYDEVNSYRDGHIEILSIVADEGTVLPEDCSYLFDSFKRVSDIDLSNADTSNVNNMQNMFSQAYSLRSVTFGSEFNTGNVTSMKEMFCGCYELESLDLSNFNTENVTDMSQMFSDSIKLQSLDLSTFNTSKVTDMNGMFKECWHLGSLKFGSNFKTGNVTDMNGMFCYCTDLESLDLSSFDTSNVEDIEQMFANCSKLKTIFASGKWNTSDVRSADNVFVSCTSLVGGNGTVFDEDNTSGAYAVIDGKDGLPGYLTGDCCSFDEETGTLTLSGNVTVARVREYAEDERVKHVYAEPGTVFPEVCNNPDENVGMFESFTAESMDLSNADVSKVKNTHLMFYGCQKLESINMSGWDTSGITDMSAMFSGCSLIEKLDLSSFDTSNVLFIQDMFGYCFLLKNIYVSDLWNMDSVSDSNNMFFCCNSLIGGNGTVFDENNISGAYAVIDGKNGLPGYLTLKIDTKIIAQPENYSGIIGSTAEFKIQAEGNELTYQWQYDNGSGWKDSGMTGAKTSTLSVPVTEARNGQKYRCIINDANGKTLTSNAAVLIVTTKITKQPVDYSGAIGDTAKFTVTATGAGLTYQWQYDNGSGWKDSGMTGAKTSTLSVPVTEARNGQKYRCIINDANGKTLTSNAAVLIVTTKITKQPVDYSGAIGDTAKFTVTATGAGLTYQWQYDNGSGWKDSGMTGAKTSTLSVPVTEARNGQKYRCIINDANGKTLTSNAAVLIVTTKITKQPVDYSGAIGDTAKFTVTATGTGLTYQWQYNSGSGWKNSNVTGSKTNTLSVAVTEGRNGLKYRCVIKDANGKTFNSDAVTLTVKAAVSAITAQPVDASGYIGDTAKFTVTATGAGLTYQWQYDNGSGWKDSGMTGAKTSTLSVPITEARNGQKYRCVIKDANGKTLTSNSAVLKVASKITKQPASVSGAVDSTVKFQVTATGAGLTYQWQYDNGSGWKDSGMTGANTDTLSVPVTAARNGQKYRCVIKDANGKTLTSSTAILTVKK